MTDEVYFQVPHRKFGL